jgi:acetyltransferase
VGASPRERSLGRVVIRNLRAGGFSGPLSLVNPHHRVIEGLRQSRASMRSIRLRTLQ